MNTAGHIGRCFECDYPLLGLESRRCPECGREFDPADRSTMNFGRAVPAWVQRSRERARWVLPVSVVAWAAGALFSAWVPQHPLVTILPPLCAYVLAGLIYLPRRATHLLAIHRYAQPAAQFSPDAPVLRKCRSMFGLLTLAAALHVPFLISYAVSSPFLYRLAWHAFTEIPASETPRAPRVCGLFLIWRIDGTAGVMTFHLPAGGRIGYHIAPHGSTNLEADWWGGLP